MGRAAIEHVGHTGLQQFGFLPLFHALAQLPLSADEIACLRDWLAALEAPGRCLELIEQAKGRPACPHCGNARCYRSGHANGLQRYRCPACRHSFNALTGTPLARLRHRDKWLPYFQCLIESRGECSANANSAFYLARAIQRH